MNKFYYFDDDRVVNLAMDAEMNDFLFQHPQRLNFLAKSIFYGQVVFDENMSLPVINFYEDEHTRLDRLFVDKEFIDFFSCGLFMFISNRLKLIFEKFNVDAFYSPAAVTLNNGFFADSFYLFCPKIALDGIDYQRSNLVRKSDSDSRVDKIEKLVIDSSKVPSQTHLFVLANTYQKIRIISQQLADALISNNITGLTVKKVEGESWMW